MVHFVTKQNQLTIFRRIELHIAYLKKYIVYNRRTAIFQIMSENPTK